MIVTDSGFTIWIFFYLVFSLPQLNHRMMQKNRGSRLNEFATRRGKVSFFGTPFFKGKGVGGGG
ncbi:MAG: hypothetical protein ACOC88_02095 [Candidatus Bipolaricaulota bacterium]